MTFDELLTSVVNLLQRQGRVSYGALRRRFGLDDAYLQDLKDELIAAQRVAADEDGRILVWGGNRVVASSPQLSTPQTPNSELRTPNCGDSPTPSAQPADAPRTEGEQRQLTILRCGLLDSAPQLTAPDSEDLNIVIDEYQTTCAEIVARYEGHVAQYLSDGLLVYFGYPVAHEDDAQRAVWAGLEMVGAIETRHWSAGHRTPPLAVSVGIHTGVVIVDVAGNSRRQGQLALGEAPTVAARLQESAEANTVVLSAATYRLVQHSFSCELLEGQELKSISELTPIYRVHTENPVREREEESRKGQTLPLVGREEELRLFLKRWEQVQEGHGQVVLLSGEAGIGKSRLVRELRRRLATDGVLQFALRCSPYHQQSAFYPLIELFQRALRFAPGDSPQDKLQKLEHELATAHLEEAFPFIAALLALPTSQSSFAELPPQKLRDQMIQMIVRMWLMTAERQPLVLVWEDLHWADPSTLDLLRLFIDQIPTARILVVLTYRPDFVPSWPSRSYVTPLMLDRLGQEQVQAIITQVAGRKAFPAEVLREIIARTDGVPLFVEELTKMVLESGLLTAQGDHYILKGPLPPLAIPTTLQDSLLARLDRLGEARAIAQLGATFGRGFSYTVLQAVATMDEENLQQALAKLVKAEVLHRRGVEPQVYYQFKHALIQEAAYQSLLKSQRQQYHQRIAQMFVERMPETKTAQPELLAHHYTEAGLATYALPYWLRAGQNAIERSTFAEAVGYLTKGLALLNTLPESAERMPQELELYIALGSALMAQKSYSAPEVEQTYAHALDLCRRIGETPRLLQALSGLAVFYLTRAELQTARELSGQCLMLARQGTNPVRLLQSLVIVGNVLFYAGEFSHARERLEEGLALYNPHLQGSQRALQDSGVNSLCYLALSLWCLGYPEQARQNSEAALALARRLNRPLNHVIAHVLTACLYQFRREAYLAFKHAELAVALASEQDFTLWAAYGTILREWTLSEQGEGKEGVRIIRQTLAATRETGAEIAHPWLFTMLTDVCLKMNQFEEGLAVVDEALDLVRRRGEGMCEAELYRLKGELVLRSGVRSPESQEERQKAKDKNRKAKMTDPRPLTPDPQTEAEVYFLQAITVAKHQQAKLWELRATTSLARLWQRQGKYHAACTTLSEIYNWFTEGAETTDLQEAKALLATLTAVAAS
jgi:class 3 adenylate cyclase/predicted ATPase